MFSCNDTAAQRTQLKPHHISIVDAFFPGFTSIATASQQYLSINLDYWTGLFCVCGMLLFFGKLAYKSIGDVVTTHLTSKTNVHDPDEAYDILES
ncbi:hypothetical protein CSPX01_03171 [Colletotrichum filicis]|nr:hypothetical protein CSPX01_03171 [Colletotrichum filicis]